jgi:hypothetical protein
MVQSLGFLRSCALFYHYLSSVAAPVELTGGPLPPDQEFIQLTRYLSLPTTPRHLLNSDFSLALGRHQDTLCSHYTMHCHENPIYVFLSLELRGLQ